MDPDLGLLSEQVEENPVPSTGQSSFSLLEWP